MYQSLTREALEELEHVYNQKQPLIPYYKEYNGLTVYIHPYTENGKYKENLILPNGEVINDKAN